MATKTVTLNGAEQQVDELGGLNALIVNNTTEPLYASAKAGVVPYTDGVIEIQSGEAQTLPDSNGTVFLLGSGGRAQLTGIVNFKMPSRRSGSGGVTEAEVNGIVTEKIAEVVANAPEDLDTLKEIADWIDGHEDSAAAMNSEIKANSADISDIQTEQETQNTDISTLQSGLSQLSNPNLLDNPDFKINQREKTTYTITSTPRNYSVDRWDLVQGQSAANPGSAAVEDDGLLLTSLSTYSIYLREFLEKGSDLIGKTVTLSVKASNAGSGWYYGQYSGQSSTNALTDGINVFTFVWSEPIVGNGMYGIHIFSRQNEETSIKIHWVKLELGDRATPFVPPHSATELLKCQRYYQRISGNYTHIGSGYSTKNAAVIVCSLITSLRIHPTINLNGTIYINSDVFNGVNGLPSTEFASPPNANQSAFVLPLKVAIPEGNEGQAVTGQFRDEESYIELSADL